MKIVTFNLQNDLIKETIDKKELLINFIKVENPDIICFQELNFKLKKYIEENIQNYIIVGTSRYQTNSFIDEYNSILIKKDIDLLETKTFPLYKRFKHDFFSIFPRICTYVKLKKANQTFQIYNTHLDHLFNYTRKHQLQILKKHLKHHEDIPTIITGDFNMTKNNPNLKDFLESKLINIGSSLTKSTLKYIHHLPIDFIIISKNIKCQSIKIDQNTHISDHYPLIAHLKLNS